jgi:UDP-glucose 4-epimerase
LVYGSGEQSRCFTWVGDVVNALVQLSTLPAAVGRVFNIGSEHEITIGALAELVKEIAESDSIIEQIRYEAAYGAGFEDMMRRVPDLTRIREAIGYKVTKTLPEIIEAVVESIRLSRNGRRTVAAVAVAR